MDNVFFNVMSYHDAVHKNTTQNRMSEQQLDHFADIADVERSPFVTGRTLFVDWSSDCLVGIGRSHCGPFELGGPFLQVADGVNAASPAGTDIVLIRPGNYNERLTFNTPATLRATRAGPVTLGRP